MACWIIKEEEEERLDGKGKEEEILQIEPTAVNPPPDRRLTAGNI